MQKTYLMFSRTTGHLKIGKSFDVNKRLVQLKSNLREDIVIIDYVSFDVELPLLNMFRDFLVFGEWFQYRDEIISLFKNKKALEDIRDKYEITKKTPSNILLENDCMVGNFVNLTKLVKTAKKDQYNLTFNLSQWLKQSETQETIKHCFDNFGFGVDVTRGRNGRVIGHKIVALALINSMSSDFKIKNYINVSDFVYESLEKNSLTDSKEKEYEMIGALFVNSKNKAYFSNYIQEVANKIRLSCGVDDWQKATENQLNKRDKIHDAIALLCDVLRNNDDAVRIAILKTM